MLLPGSAQKFSLTRLSGSKLEPGLVPEYPFPFKEASSSFKLLDILGKVARSKTSPLWFPPFFLTSTLLLGQLSHQMFTSSLVWHPVPGARAHSRVQQHPLVPDRSWDSRAEMWMADFYKRIEGETRISCYPRTDHW